MELSLTGFDQPIIVTKPFVISDSYEGKGLVVHAQNEAGQPLANGHVYLFEKLPPWNDGMNDGTVYRTVLTYDTDMSDSGMIVIPYNDLLKGRNYELEIVGDSSDGGHEVVYHRAVSREDRDIQFNSTELKHITVKAIQAKSGDELFFNVLDDRNQLSAWPMLTLFGDNHQAELYVQSDNPISMITKLYDTANDTGYLLSGVANPAAGAQTVDLNGETIEIKPASSLDNGRVDINGRLTQDARYAHRYLVSKGMDLTATYYVESEGYRYTFAKSLTAANRDVSLEVGRDFVNKRSEQQFFAVGVVNRRVYTDYRDQFDNALIDVANAAVAKIADSVDASGVQFMVDNAGKNQNMTVQTDGENGFIYEAVAAAANQGSAMAAGSVLDYQLYDSSNQAFGDKLPSQSPVLVQANLLMNAGEFALKLTHQNFPTDVVKLTGQANLSISDYSEYYKQIPISLPAGYRLANNYGEANLQSLQGTESLGYIWVDQGILKLPIDLDLASDRKYALHVVLNLNSSSIGNVVYYRQLVLTGAELKNLKQIDAASSAGIIQPKTNDLPNKLQIDRTEIEFPVPGYGKSYRTQVNVTDWFNGTLTYGKILMNPQDFGLVINGWDGASTAYSLRRDVHVDSATGKWSVTNPGMHLLQLQGNRPFTAFDVRIEGSGQNGYSYSFHRFMDKAYVSPGKQRFFFVMNTQSSDEVPWEQDWLTRSAYDMDEDTTVPYSGHIDVANSSLLVSPHKAYGQTVLNVNPELLSGDLELQNTSVKNARDGFDSLVPGIVTIKNSMGSKVYESIAYNWPEGNEITKTLAPGTYSITYRQPVGPNEEAIVSNSFMVSADNGNGSNPGGGSPGGGIPGGGGAPGGAVPVGDSDTDLPAAPNAVTFKPEDIPAPVNGVVTLPIQDSEAAVMPGSMLSGDGATRTLELAGSHGKVSIPPAVLQQLAGLVGSEQLSDAQFTLTLKPIGANALPGAVHAETGMEVRAAGTVYDLTLSITPKGGKPALLSTFNAPITLTFDVNANADPHVTNVYYIADDGSLTYVPAERANGKLVAKVSHFSKYGVLEVHKAFADVGASHWARGAIEELAAKQFVTGVTATTFAPNKPVTRAEFTAMLVHALGVKASGSSGFKDVPANAWYASDVAAAYEHKLIQGIGADTFAPNKTISREEMAVILANAFKQLGVTASAAQASAFKDDAAISSWAADAVALAYANGLIQGDAAGLFKPKGSATRAEAAQMLVNLLRRAAR
ncbi:S-layer homology domain-containing protein [Paenibacillus glycinis]|uniref:SLH domain-containing protein n=1 Tax=Paenibacillus glycinis TaxID=2697035 RepID=A0ABW9XM93_9BACL|nr:S-layer homology domain-containing protein [Paenibacillus glycinis]NBD23746.1 hypothetical protein [Paenibacillus glycinis]